MHTYKFLCATLVLRTLFEAAASFKQQQKLMSPFEQRPKYDEIIIYAGQGSKIHLFISSGVIPHKL
jgi:hypothetical protein